MSAIRKKTLIMDGANGIQFKVGDAVLLFERINDTLKGGEFDVEICNNDARVPEKKYHGYIGTDNQDTLYGYGVRRILQVTDLYEKSSGNYKKRKVVYKITVGNEIHPEWE